MEKAPPRELKKMAMASPGGISTGTVGSSDEKKKGRGGGGPGKSGKRLTPRRHILGTEHDLHGNKRDLDASPGPDARHDLIADPPPRATVHAQRIQQGGADGEDGGADPHEGRVPAEGGDAAADDNGREGGADEVGDGADAGAFGGGAFDGLEVEGQVEDVGVDTHC